MSRKVDVIKAYKKLPYEAQQQLDNVLSDDKLELKDISINYLIDDVKWTVDRMNMDMNENEDDLDVYNEALKTKNECLKWLKYYSKYDK